MRDPHGKEAVETVGCWERLFSLCIWLSSDDSSDGRSAGHNPPKLKSDKKIIVPGHMVQVPRMTCREWAKLEWVENTCLPGVRTDADAYTTPLARTMTFRNVCLVSLTKWVWSWTLQEPQLVQDSYRGHRLTTSGRGKSSFTSAITVA